MRARHAVHYCHCYSALLLFDGACIASSNVRKVMVVGYESIYEHDLFLRFFFWE